MSSLVLAHGAPDLKLKHFEFNYVAQAVQAILSESRKYVVRVGDDVCSIESGLGACIGQNIFSTKNLIGKTIEYNGEVVTLPSGTTFPAINRDRFTQAA